MPHAHTPAEAVQLLTPDGERKHHPDYRFDPTPDRLLGLYEDMVRARRIDAEGVLLQRQGELALWPSLLGQEAAQIGSARALDDEDHVFPSYRDHGVALARNVDPLDLFALFRGTTNGGWDPREHNVHLYTLVIGAQTLHATGYAMGVAKDGAESAVIVYFGDGATSQGDVSEAFNFAALNDAPVVFFCQNNQWAISEPADRQSRVPIHRRAAGFGFPGILVDGNDVLACLAVTREALRRARSGEGPTLIEAFTYRMGAHTTSDDPTRYRDAEEVRAWERKDPITRLRTYLLANGWADEESLARIDRACDEAARSVRAAVRSMAAPPAEAMFAHVYADGHTLVAEEAAQFAALAAGSAHTAGSAAAGSAPAAGSAHVAGSSSTEGA
ncbi:pyruvate dehydrogenase (acetyl-transferring) E1 component subunit alpha [Kitasatospora sp. NPDC059599]|uniref:pyruvate dehydrogenase (acetyl-transferring) E1 component subunit alpha n=1 Tax=Kitasatospora sp. NPDC059599 TaxID=3346880 RepID=UPI0036D0B324